MVHHLQLHRFRLKISKWHLYLAPFSFFILSVSLCLSFLEALVTLPSVNLATLTVSFNAREVILVHIFVLYLRT